MGSSTKIFVKGSLLLSLLLCGWSVVQPVDAASQNSLKGYPRSGIERSGTGIGATEKERAQGQKQLSISNAQPENLKPYWPRPGNSTLK